MYRLFTTTSLSILALSLGAVSAASAQELSGRAEVNWRYGTERAILMTEFWVPLMQDEDSVLYGDVRLMGDDQDNREGNIGIGYRKVTSFAGFKGVAGAHGWIDRRITARGSTFHQTTLGAEWLGEDLDILLNAYIPLSDKEEHIVANASPEAAAFTGTGIVVDTDGTVLEEPQGGFDLELGLELGEYSDFVKNHTDSVRIYGGGYYFNGDDTDHVAGWRTRIAADISSDIQVGARFQRDGVRGSQGFLEATIRFPFGQKRSYREDGIRARLDESPERDIDIVTGDVVTDTGDRVAVVNQATGAAQEIIHVDNTAAGGGDGSVNTPFNSLAAAEAAASAHTIIYLNTGDGANTNQDQGLTLNKTGQQLIGAGTNFVFDSGTFTTANGANPSGLLLAAAGTAPVITNINATSDGITITADNVTVAGVTVDGATRDGIVVEADGAAASAMNVTIKDVTAQNNRMGVYIHGADGGAVTAKVENTVTTANTQHGVAVYDDTTDTFEADLGGGSLGSTGNNVLAANTLEDLAVELDGGTLMAQNNWWGQATGADTDDPTIGIAPQIYYGAPINDGLVGHWTFDTEWMNGTTAYDRSGQGNDGAMNGGLNNTDIVAGNGGSEALQFNGTSDYINAGNDASINSIVNEITIVTLIEPERTNNSAIITNSRDSSGAYDGFNLAQRDPMDNFTFRLWDTAGSPINATGASTNLVSGYQHVASTWDGAQMITYVDNVANTPTAYGGNIGSPASFDTHIGRLAHAATWFFEGSMDDIRVYSRDLTASEVSELYRMNTSSTVNISSFLTSAP
jgi:hypothetical protein